MLLRDYLAGTRLEVGGKPPAPSSIRESTSLSGRGLHWRHCLPTTVGIIFAPAMVRGDEDLRASRSSGPQDLPHILDDVVRLKRRAAEFVELAALREEVVVRVDDKQPRQFGLVGQLGF